MKNKEYDNFSKEDLEKMQADLFNMQIEDNPNMVFDENNLVNLGLNPKYYSGPNSTLTNALNHSYTFSNISITKTAEFKEKFDKILLDVDSDFGNKLWDLLKQEMGADSLIEGLYYLYTEVIPNYSTNQELKSKIASKDDLINIYDSINSKL